MFVNHFSIAACILALFSIAVLYLWRNRTAIYAGKRLPPGPPRLPLIGSFFQMPSRHDWLTYETWEKKYDSDMVHVDVLGSHVVILNSIEAATELLEHRSSIYSDRLDSPVIRVLLGFDWIMASIPYNDNLKSMRKMIETFFRPTALKEYHPVETRAVNQLLNSLMDKPEKFTAHLRQMAGAIILELGYGFKVEPSGDPHIKSAEKAMHALTTSISHSARIFDYFPLAMYLPSWFPGASYKKYARGVHHCSVDTRENPWIAAKEALAKTKASPSFAGKVLDRLETKPSPEEESMAKLAVRNLYLGGADTTVCALEIFVLAMTKYPEAQKRAQAEIDSIIGPDRLLTFEDKDILPYVNALTTEVFRWRNVTPLGTLGIATFDDWYSDSKASCSPPSYSR